MSFSGRLGILISEYQRRIEKIVVDSRKEISNRISQRTPVDTGAARRNWKAEPADFRGDVYTYTNDLRTIPYIRRLEYDRWSPQAPSGMVRISAAEWHDIVSAIVRLNT